LKTGACLLVLLLLAFGAGATTVDVVAQDDSGITLSFDFSSMADVTDETGEWAGCTLPGPGFSAAVAGGISVPVDVMLFAVPPSGDVRLSVISAVVRDERAPGFAAGSLDSLVETGDLPGVPAEITATGFMRRQRIAALRICPVPFDAGEGRFRVYERLVVRLVFRGSGEGAAWSAPARRDEFEDIYRSLLANYEQGRAWRSAAPRRLSAAEGDYFSSSPNWVKVKIESTGVYRITGVDLADAGVVLSTVDPATLRLYGGGGLPLSENLLDTNPAWMDQMPLKVTGGGDGRIDLGDSLIFYALGMRDWTNLYEPGRDMESYYKSFFSDYNYYWLTWGGTFSSEPKRMEVRDLPSCGGCDYYQPPSFMERVHVEIDAINDFNVRADDGWYWRPLRLDETVRLTPDTPSPDPDRDGMARVRLADWHGTGDCIGGYFRVTMNFNSRQLVDSVWQASQTWRYVVDIDHTVDVADADEQEIAIRMLRNIPPAYPGTSCSKLYLAWYEMYYWRRFVAAGNRLHFFSPDSTCLARYVVGGFTTPSIYAFDVTDQRGVSELRGTTTTGSTSFQVSFYDSADEHSLRRYALVGRGYLMKPVSLKRATISDIRHRPGSDYLIITHDDLLGAAETMRAYHSGAEVVTVGEIYDEFGWGVPDVTAIRDFLRWRLDTGAALHSVLLLGDATWDYKGYHAAGGYYNYVPAYERNYLPPVGDPYCTDDFFGYLTPNKADGSDTADSVDYYLDVAISRIPATSPADASFLVGKSIAYQSDPVPGRWQNRVCQVADDDKVGSDCDSRAHTMDMEIINDEAYPVEFERKKVYLVEYPLDQSGLKPSARADFIATLNSGVLMANYVGHGDEHRLAQEEVLNPSSVPLVNTGRKEFFFIAATCNVSRFDEVTLSSMCEDLLKRPNGGSIGSFASTHFCIPQRNRELNLNFVDSLYVEGTPYKVRPIADAVVLGKARTGSNGSAYRSNSEMYALFGDPALELFSPKLEIEFDAASADTLHRKGTYEFSGRVLDGDTVATWLDGVVDVVVNEAEDAAGYMSCAGYYDFELPGNEIFRGEAGVSNGRFSFSFLVSTDAMEGPRAQMRGILASGGYSGAGLLDSLTIQGEVASADEEGPKIALVSGQGDVSPGDTVSVRVGERLRLDLSDSSGVAIRAKSAFIPSVSIMLDDGERIDLTDSVYAAVDDFRKSNVYFDVPAASPGVHDLVVSAFDNVNNFSQESFKMVVEGSIAGQTNVVYVYPNPVSDLCYIICEYERMLDVEISMFTVTGREIWTYRSSGARSYHEIPWRGRDAAGDRVANGTYLLRVEATDPEDPSYSLTGNVVLAVIR
jgi:hypothetical protein